MDFKVSIIIPYISDRGYLRAAVDSCQHQHGLTIGYDYELILSQSAGTLGVNVNRGVERAKGKYIKILADDDLLTPNCLIDLWTKAEEGYDIVCANAVNFIDGNGDGEVYKSVIPATVHDLANENTIHGGTTLYSRETMPLWDEKIWTAEEYELHLRMAAAGLRFGYVDSVVHRYRIHETSKSQLVWSLEPDKYELRDDYKWMIRSKYFGNAKSINIYHSG